MISRSLFGAGPVRGTRSGRRNVRRLTATLAASTLVISLAACGGASQSAPAGSSSSGHPSVLNVGVSSDVSTLSMATYATGFDNHVLTLIFDSLIARDKEGKLQPGLALSWEPNDDYTQWTFELRPDVKFHNGETMTAEDVAFDINTWKDPEFEGGVGSFYTEVENATAVDDLTVEVDLTGPSPRFARNLALFRSPIVPKSVVESAGGLDEIGKAPETAVGTGPFKVEEWRTGERLVLSAFADYWDGKPAIETLNLIVMSDAATRVAALLAGDIDIATNFPLDQRDELADNNAQMLTASPPLHVFMNMNAANGPFSSLELRQAANHAIDKAKINDELLGGTNTIVWQFALPVEIGFISDLEDPYPYDPDKARELVAEAGYADGVEVNFVVNTGSLNAREVGAAIGEMLSDVGITPTITYASPDEWSTASNEKAYDISYTYNTGGGNFSVDDPMRVLFDGERGNPRWTGFYVNDEVQALQDELTQTADDEGGIELMEQIGQILVDDAALVPMYQQPELWGVSMDLDWTPSAVSYDFKDAVWK